MGRALPLLAVLLTGLLTGCFASHQRATPGRDASPGSADDAGPLDAGWAIDAGPPLPCFCEGATPCTLPRMCCPVTGTCEDPSRFRCTGSTMSCP